MAVSLLHCTNTQEILKNLRKEFCNYKHLLPENKNSYIVIKPNLNSNLDALTGNTTDLRVLAAVLRILTENGYKNITIMEGPNGGFHRDGIDVFVRNRINKIAEHYGCRFKDVNYEEKTLFLQFEGAGRVEISKAFKDCDLFINIPKLKTHYETLISVALKSLIGILVGQSNKAKTHASLFENILRLNDEVKSDLYIVDGLIAMEGAGPSAGKPVRTDLVLVGTNPYEIDILACRIMGFSPEDCPLIQKALTTGRISKSFLDEVSSIELPLSIQPFEQPNPALIARLVKIQGFGSIVRTVRNWPPVSRLLKYVAVRRIMLLLGMTQEIIINQERDVKLKWNEEKCKSCFKCASYCPQMIDLPTNLLNENSNCIDCLYCYAVCPEHAIEVEGELGFYKEQLRRYDSYIRGKL